MEKLMSDILKSLNLNADAAPFLKFSELLLKKNEVMNLTAITDPREVCLRHFADSLSLLSVCDFKNKKVIDVGCGAGFPGFPLRLAESSISLCLLDSLGKRINFLKEVCSELGISDVDCVHARAEEAAQDADFRESFDIAVSRAVADLSVLSELTLPFVKQGGVFIAMKAQNCDEELESASRAIATLGAVLEDRIDYPLFDTGITHTALVFRKTKPTHAKYPRRFAKIKASPL